MDTYVALLRGINVGGNATVGMAQLKTCFEKLGYEAVKTYINSGNVIFKTKQSDPRKLEVAIETALEATFSFHITVVVHNLEEIGQIIKHIPKSWHTNKDQKCNIIFLRHTVDKPAILDTFQLKPGIEELHYFPGVLFWSAQTSNLTKSTMLKVNRLPIYKDMTIRGQNTTHKIYELMQTAAKT